MSPARRAKKAVPGSPQKELRMRRLCLTLEIDAYLVPPYDADRCFESQLVSMMVGSGDDRETAEASVTVSAERFKAEFGPMPPQATL